MCRFSGPDSHCDVTEVKKIKKSQSGTCLVYFLQSFLEIYKKSYLMHYRKGVA